MYQVTSNILSYHTPATERIQIHQLIIVLKVKNDVPISTYYINKICDQYGVQLHEDNVWCGLCR